MIVNNERRFIFGYLVEIFLIDMLDFCLIYILSEIPILFFFCFLLYIFSFFIISAWRLTFCKHTIVRSILISTNFGSMIWLMISLALNCKHTHKHKHSHFPFQYLIGVSRAQKKEPNSEANKEQQPNSNSFRWWPYFFSGWQFVWFIFNVWLCFVCYPYRCGS